MILNKALYLQKLHSKAAADAAAAHSHVVSLVPFPLHPHMLRHTYATTLYRARVDLRTAQKLMGHSSIQVTADIYTHLEQEDSLHVADKLNEYLSGKSENSVKSSQKVVKLAI